jgi:hypothetical protein
MGWAVPAAAATSPLPSGVEVQWSGAAGCPDRSGVEADIARRLADRHGDLRAVVVVALVAQAGGGYALDLTIRTSEFVQRRHFESTDCGVLGRAVALVTSIAVEPEATAGQVAQAMETAVEAETEAASVPQPSIVPTLEPIRVPSRKETDAATSTEGTPDEDGDLVAIDDPIEALAEDAPSERSRGPIDVVFGLRGGVATGVLPGAGGGALAAVGLAGRHWRVEGRFSYWPPRRSAFLDDPDVGARFDLFSGGVRGCGVPAVGRVEFPLCGGAELARLRAGGFGAPLNLNAAGTWSALAAGASLIWWPLRWFGLSAGAEGLVAVSRPGFAGEGRGELHRAGPAAVRALAGVEFRLSARASSDARSGGTGRP